MPDGGEHAADPEPTADGIKPVWPLPDDEVTDDLVSVGGSLSLAAAHDEGLVVLACGEPYWVVRREDGYELLVLPDRAQIVQRQLELYREESKRPLRPREPVPRTQPLRWSLLLLSPLFWAVMFAWEKTAPAIRDVGMVDSGLVAQGDELWRLVTALSLHADIGHLMGNCMGWLLFGGFLGSTIGVGSATLLAVIGGVLGNGVNALLSGDELHSLGASTALFAALGAQTSLAFFQRQGRLWQRVAVPLLSALALLALLGTGEVGRTDVGAHLWGFVAGLLITLPFARPLLKQKATWAYDGLFMAACAGLFYLGWSLALG